MAAANELWEHHKYVLEAVAAERQRQRQARADQVARPREDILEELKDAMRSGMRDAPSANTHSVAYDAFNPMTERLKKDPELVGWIESQGLNVQLLLTGGVLVTLPPKPAAA